MQKHERRTTKKNQIIKQTNEQTNEVRKKKERKASANEAGYKNNGNTMTMVISYSSCAHAIYTMVMMAVMHGVVQKFIWRTNVPLDDLNKNSKHWFGIFYMKLGKKKTVPKNEYQFNFFGKYLE